eukprot:TRINITY_DN68824_c0_g1_i1.p1 TRINITY_DN68824_c0_g1~~TRINITY_DN68824_c0_g1_i1.p1  ORF type:complete len:380 (+),score=54.71 TRINITY_DN68824_c0_g1_i1:125-1141(+)
MVGDFLATSVKYRILLSGVPQTLPLPTVHAVAFASDERLLDFANLKSQRASRARASYIIAEGADTIRQLVASDFEIGAILLQQKLLDELQPELAARRARGGPTDGPADVFAANASILEEVTGLCVSDKDNLAFATVRRKADTSSVAQIVAVKDVSKPLRVLALDGLTDAANVGALMRVAIAFGVDMVLCSATCCDPFHARAVRASQGYVFCVPTFRGNLPDMMKVLRDHNVLTAAAVVQDGARFLDEIGGSHSLPQRWAMVVGSEHFGVSKEVRHACELLLKVRMAEGVDSLNVVVSAGVLLHGCTEREEPRGRASRRGYTHCAARGHVRPCKTATPC